jgi:hypothetical protein
MDELEMFNPNEFTDRELLKLVYRDLHGFRVEFEEYKKTNNYNKEIQDLKIEQEKIKNDILNERQLRKLDIENETKLRENSARQTKIAMAVATFVIVALTFLLNFVIK